MRVLLIISASLVLIVIHQVHGVSDQIAVPVFLRSFPHLEHQVSWQLLSLAQLNCSHGYVFHVLVLEDSFDDNVFVVFQHSVFLSVTAHPLFFFDFFLLLIEDEKCWTFDGSFLVRVECPEHAEGRSSEDVNLKVLVMSKRKSALSDGLLYQVPNEGVIDDFCLRIPAFFVGLCGIAVHYENVGLELPHVVDGSRHLSESVGFIEAVCSDWNKSVYAFILNISVVNGFFVDFVDVEDKSIGESWLMPNIHRMCICLYYVVPGVPDFSASWIICKEYFDWLLIDDIKNLFQFDISQLKLFFTVISLFFDTE